MSVTDFVSAIQNINKLLSFCQRNSREQDNIVISGLSQLQPPLHCYPIGGEGAMPMNGKLTIINNDPGVMSNTRKVEIIKIRKQQTTWWTFSSVITLGGIFI